MEMAYVWVTVLVDSDSVIVWVLTAEMVEVVYLTEVLSAGEEPAGDEPAGEEPAGEETAGEEPVGTAEVSGDTRDEPDGPVACEAGISDDGVV